MMAVADAKLRELLRADNPAVCFVTNIGDAIMTLPTLRALAEMFTAPMTVICPKAAFDLCFREVSSRFVDTTGMPLTGAPPRPGQPDRPFDYEALIAQIGTVDVFIDTLPWNSLSNVLISPLLQRLAPATSIGFTPDNGYDIVVGKGEIHSADLMFNFARLFDPSLRIENYARPMLARPTVRREAESIRAAEPAKVLVVHADSNWTEKQWPAARFVELLDRFLTRHRDFVAWIVGMGDEELRAGRERDRVHPLLGLPLDLTVSLVATADLFVGIDSSMLHAADLAGVPGVGLFGATRAATWGFRFGPHRHVDRNAMSEITVEEVLAAMEALVAQALAGGRTG